jgi:hypothetical protein
MKNRWLQFAVVALAFAACAVAQDASGDRVCTDLSGKVRLLCPHEKQQDSAAKPVGQETTERGQPEFQPSIVPISASAGSVSSSTGAVDEGAPTPAAAPVLQSSHPYRFLERSFARNFVADQKRFWTSPLKLRVEDAQWVVPLVGAMTVVTLSDGSIERKLPTNASFIKQSKTFSDYGVVTYAGAVASAYLWSRATHNDHMRETAVLSGEAALNSLLITEGIKYVAGRNRPLENDGTGRFLNGGSSFPSGHSSTAWAIASVIAREYPGPLTQFLAYGGAAAISAARVTGRQHFTSDVLVGGAIGWFMGRQVYNAHHDGADFDRRYGTFERDQSAEGHGGTEKMASPYVPLDSWVYPAMDRLVALGYIHTAFAGMRPWTRMECARLLEEADSKLVAENGVNAPAQRLYDALKAEFAIENRRSAGGRNLGAEVESIYTRFTGISGMPLTDGFHLGQTLVNDYGRPYQEGFNLVTGFSSHAEAGPLTFYVRGEYQHAPSAPPLPLSARQAEASADSLPSIAPATVIPEVNRFRLLNAYIALKLDNWQFSFGKQSLSWGPGIGGAMMFSNNAEPITMVRMDRVTPFKLPSILGWLGPIRTEGFFGQLSGYEFIANPSGLTGNYGRSLDPQPYIHGQRISFKPTPDLELGFSRTTIYGGPGYPLTWHTFFRSLLSTGNALTGNASKPGDRRSGMDFTFRLPGLRNWLTFYGDGFTEDEYSPIAYPDRSVWHAGLYLSHFPSLSKLDLRVEGSYSDNPLGGNLGPGYYFFNSTWRSGYTNNGNLIGSWIGRAGQGAQAWTTYHFTPKNYIQLYYLHQKVSHEFIPNGGTLENFGVRGDIWSHSTMSVSSFVQYERWTFPVIARGPQSNVTTSVQFTFRPGKKLQASEPLLNRDPRRYGRNPQQ